CAIATCRARATRARRGTSRRARAGPPSPPTAPRRGSAPALSSRCRATPAPSRRARRADATRPKMKRADDPGDRRLSRELLGVARLLEGRLELRLGERVGRVGALDVVFRRGVLLR